MPRAARHLLFGVVACGAALYLTFFAAAGAIEVVTLLATVVGLIWVATVDISTLLAGNGRPRFDLALLFTMGLVLIISGGLLLRSGTMLLSMAIGLATVVVAVVRVTRRSLQE